MPTINIDRYGQTYKKMGARPGASLSTGSISPKMKKMKLTARYKGTTKGIYSLRGNSAVTTQHRALVSLVDSMALVDSPSVLRNVTRALMQSLESPQIKKAHPNSVLQDVQLELRALQRSFDFRRSMLKDTIPTTEVAKLLGISRQAVNERERKGTFLAAMDGGQLRFPIWQFDPMGSHGVVEGLPSTLRALDENAPMSPLAKMSWLRKPNSSLGGSTPELALRAGRLDEVLSAARGVGLV